MKMVSKVNRYCSHEPGVDWSVYWLVDNYFISHCYCGLAPLPEFQFVRSKRCHPSPSVTHSLVICTSDLY